MNAKGKWERGGKGRKVKWEGRGEWKGETGEGR